ncbi:MAG: hypothetical protein IK119_01255, partial [Bacteroidales bacterium]|nr:hypothetical protein [Bacteroidales bacterium]
MGHQLLYSLLRDPEVARKVATVRQVKASGFAVSWLETEEYKDWYQRLKPDKRAAVDKLDDPHKVEAFCNGKKTSLPLVIFIANYLELPNSKGVVGRWRQKAGVCLNGLCVIDVDHVVNFHDPELVREYWQKVTAHLDLKEVGILMAYVSVSGDGLKIVFKARTEWGNLIDNQHKMAALLGVPIDEKCKDGSRGHFITTEQDILYIDEEELYDYENKEFAEKYNQQYRNGNTQPTLFDNSGTVAGCHTAKGDSDYYSKDSKDSKENLPLELRYHGIALEEIIGKLLGGNVPGQGDRHDKMRDLAHQLRYVCDNSPKKVLAALKTQQWVNDLIAEGDPVEATVEGACKLKYGRKKPEELTAALVELGAQEDSPSRELQSAGGAAECSCPYEDWGREIEEMFDDYPCLREVCLGLKRNAYPAALFSSAALFGTLMTRTWYFYYHRSEEERRLNYCIFIIGDPGSGKSFVGRLYKLIAAPIIYSDKVGNDAINKYKKDLKARGTSSKEQKKEALQQPDVIIRIHGTRTANGVFIEDMNKAVEMVGDKPMHLHMLTFDAELDSSTLAQKGGQWIDKSTMELKAFHNEEDNQQYKNVDSVNGPFDVYWNFIYTGTPLSLHKKVTERNFGSGLSTRLAVIELPDDEFEMMERRQAAANREANERLKEWAFRLDKVSGLLPVDPLVDEIWEWTRDHLAIAKINNDKADKLLLKRVGYYGIGIAAPYIMMRHWEEWEALKTFTIDKTDLRLCNLVLEIQYRCQHHFFGEYARKYYDDMQSDPTIEKRRNMKTRSAYALLPATFELSVVSEVFGCSDIAARVLMSRLCKDGVVKRTGKGMF